MNRSSVIYDLYNPIYRLHRGSRAFLPWIFRRTFPWWLLAVLINPVIFLFLNNFNPVAAHWGSVASFGFAVGFSWLTFYAAVAAYSTMTYALKHGRFEEMLMTPLEPGRVVTGFLMVPFVASIFLLLLILLMQFLVISVGSFLMSPSSFVRNFFNIFVIIPIVFLLIAAVVPLVVILPNLLLGFFLALKLRGRPWSLAAVVIAVIIIEICCIALSLIGYIAGKGLMMLYLWGRTQRMVRFYDAGEV